MIVAECNGTGDFFGLVHGQSCGVLAISIPVRGFFYVLLTPQERILVSIGAF